MAGEDTVKQFLDWLRSGATGCMFARALAVQADKAKWRSTVYTESLPAELGAELHTRILESFTLRDEVHQFFFPAINDAAGIVALTKAICSHPSWTCGEIPLHDQVGAMAIALRWQHPDPGYVNWIIGFANIVTMPPTRRAPSTSILIRTGMPSPTAGIAKGMLATGAPNPHEIDERKKDSGRIPIHVADVPSLVKTHQQMAGLWEASMHATHERLKDFRPNDAAKAKTTFVLPEDARADLDALLK